VACDISRWKYGLSKFDFETRASAEVVEEGEESSRIKWNSDGRKRKKALFICGKRYLV